MYKLIKNISLVSIFTLASSTALAVPVHTDGFNDLADVMNDMGIGHYDTVADQAQQAYWSHSAVGANSQFVFTDIGFGASAGDSLGIFSFLTGEQLELFDNSGTASASVSFLADGSARAVQVDTDGVELNSTSIAGFGDIFGFYVTHANTGTFYSDSGMNQTYTAGDGNDYSDWMIAFQGDGTVTNAYNGFAGGEFGTNDWLIAFDGLLHGAGQLDFNDAVILVESVQPVPVPAAVWLFSTGLLGLLGVARRRT